MASSSSSKGKFSPQKPKNKLRTSKDVYDRLKWDPSSTGIDTSGVFIGYLDRFLGNCEIPLSAYSPGGDIPYHRIYYFRTGGPPIFPRIGEQGEVQVRLDNWPPNATTIWDRETRVDLIFNSGETKKLKRGKSKIPDADAEVTESVTKIPSGYSEVPCYTFNMESGEWEPVTEVPNCPKISENQLSIITYNVLYELYSPEISEDLKRWALLISYLKTLSDSTDIFCLTEVTSSFLALLENEDWIKENYFLSEISKVSETIQPYGQLLVSRIPAENIFFSDDPLLKKRFLIPVFNSWGIILPIIHLKSDYSEDNRVIRARQVSSVISTCEAIRWYKSVSAKEKVVVLVGDTNFFSENEEGISILAQRGYQDLWPLLKGCQDPGFTFDVMQNALAQLSKKKISSRVDRFYFKEEGEGGSLSPLEMFLVGNEKEFGGSPFSDHFGLKAVFSLKEVMEESAPNLHRKDHKLVYTSSVISGPSDNDNTLWKFIQERREKYDPSFKRWMPHINLLYAFIEDDEQGLNFEEAEEKFKDALAPMEPFKCVFSSIKYFHHKHFTYAYLAPDDNDNSFGNLRKLQETLENEYPNCSEQSSKSEEGFVPHLTLGKFTNKEFHSQEVQEMMEDWKTKLEELQETGENYFDVDSIFLISRKGSEEPFIVRKTVKLGGQCDQNNGEASQMLENFLSSHNLLPTPEREKTVSLVIEIITKLVKKALKSSSLKTLGNVDPKIEIQLCGSRKMGFHNDQSDLDLLFCGPEDLDATTFFENLSQTIAHNEAETPIKLHSITTETLVPIIRFSIMGISTELVYANLGFKSEAEITMMSEKEVDYLTETNYRSITAVRDANEILSKIEDNQVSIRAFQSAVRFLRFWAQRRGVSSHGFAFLKSLPLAVMIAAVAIKKKGQFSTKIVTEFFKTYSAWDWKNSPVHISKEISKPDGKKFRRIPELMKIHAPSYPYQNKGLAVTRSTLHIIKTELNRAANLLQNLQLTEESLETLVEDGKEEFLQSYEQLLEIEIKGCNLGDIKICSGFLHSRIISLIVNLEKMGRGNNILVHPFPRFFVKVGDGNENIMELKDDQISFENFDEIVSDSSSLQAFIALKGTKASGTENKNSIDAFVSEFKAWSCKPKGSVLDIRIRNN